MYKSYANRFALFVGALLWSSASLWSQDHDHHAPKGDPPPPVTVSIGAVSGKPGDEVEIPITIKGAKGIGPMEMLLTYDPKILEAKPEQCAKQGPLLTSALFEARSDPVGRMAILWATSDAINGEGVVVLAKFTVKGTAGEKSPLTLSDVRVWARDHPSLDAMVTVESGEFTVAGGGFPWWWLCVAAFVLFVLLLLLIVFFLRRKRPEPQQQKPGAKTEPAKPQAKAPVAMVPCPSCAKPIQKGLAFCPHCGSKIVQKPKSS